MTSDIVERIFSDGHVVDIDLSEWDRFVALLVLADHVEKVNGLCPPFLVVFSGVAEVSVKFRHHGVDIDDPEAHFQWLVHAYREMRVGRGLSRVEISGPGSSPDLSLVFRDVEVEQLTNHDLDVAFPGWAAPSSPFARPGLKAMLRARRRR